MVYKCRIGRMELNYNFKLVYSGLFEVFQGIIHYTPPKKKIGSEIAYSVPQGQDALNSCLNLCMNMYVPTEMYES